MLINSKENDPSLLLRQAAHAGNYTAIEQIISENKVNNLFNINAISSTTGNSALLWAAAGLKNSVEHNRPYNNFTLIILKLLQCGADANVVNRKRDSLVTLTGKTQEKLCSEAILEFITKTACPYGATNRGDPNVAREKFMAITEGNDKSLDWNKLDNNAAEPWSESELKGVKAVIANDIMLMKHPDMKRKAIRSFDDVKETARISMEYGTGRCAALAALGVVYSQEIAPQIFTRAVSVPGHTFLLVGLKPDETGTPRINRSTYFCDPWTNDAGTIQDLEHHLSSIGYDTGDGNCIELSQWVPDGSVSPENPVTPQWLAERTNAINHIENRFNQFIEKNNELKEENGLTLSFNATGF